MKKIFFLAGFVCVMGIGISVLAQDGTSSFRLTPQWTATLKKPLWGMTLADIDGNGLKELVLLERSRLGVGTVKESGFEEHIACEWTAGEVATRVYGFDVDGDQKDELIVSAVQGGIPSSLVLKVTDGRCQIMGDHLRWSLRVALVPVASGEIPKKTLLGQGSTPQEFFSGAVHELEWTGGKLQAVRKIALPKRVGIFDFVFVPAMKDFVGGYAVLAGYEPVVIHEREGKRFARIFRTPGRFGGTLNEVPATQRTVLDETHAEVASFGIPPLLTEDEKGIIFLLPWQDLTLKSVVGRTPLIRSSALVILRPEPTSFIQESARSTSFSGPLIDIVSGWGSEKKQVLTLTRSDGNVTGESQRMLLSGFVVDGK